MFTTVQSLRGLRPRVLIVDDDAQDRALLKELLQGEDIAVVGEAENGLDGVDKAHELAPDVVLMDVRMPGVGGLEAARIMARELPFTQVIILTAYEGPLPTRTAEDAGVYAFLVKGCSMQLMKDVISAAWHYNAGIKLRFQETVAGGSGPA
jgi:DNA-binding NarL/FixJ family response regulator